VADDQHHHQYLLRHKFKDLMENEKEKSGKHHHHEFNDCDIKISENY